MTVENGRWLRAADTTPSVDGTYRVKCEAGLPDKAHFSLERGWAMKMRNSNGFIVYEPLSDVTWWLQLSPQEAPAP